MKATRRELVALSGLTAGALLLPEAESAARSRHVPATDEAPLPDGVKAVWDLKLAHSDKTSTRERISLNGLWRWQPVQEQSNNPASGAWGWFKAPGCWPGITDYMQKDCQTFFPHDSWKLINMRDVSLAWYQREFAVPADWKGRRISISLEYLNTFATVYIDSKNAGEIRFPAGELDISAYARPGEKHLLSILVQAAPLKAVMLSYTDTNGAREVKGSVARRGLCGDVWLTGTPKGARITDVKIETSVTKGEITFELMLEGLTAGVAYAAQSQIAVGDKLLHSSAAHKFTSNDLQNGRIRFTEKWRPENLWDVHTPQNQYNAALTLSTSSALLDRALPVRFGFREFVIKGKDFYLNGTRIYLQAEQLINAQIGAEWASYEGAKETFQRFKNLGINFLYTGNYSCEPGVHLGFSEILRAADDSGMLISFTQPHFSSYDWKAPDADKNNGYALHAEWYVRVAQNHPSVVCYATSHNATGYVEQGNPDRIDGIPNPLENSGGNALLALRAEAIIKRFDTSRVIYHHSSGNLGSMHTMNFYVNFAPIQELSDWFEHWETRGVKPLFLCEYGCPYSWDWTMYRGWYQGKREWGGADVPWEFCNAEWNAQFVGDTAYKIGEREKTNLRWEAERFKNGQVWHHWDYPTQVGSDAFPDTNIVFHDYYVDNNRAHRTRGVSAFGPAEYQMYWSLKGNADRSRKLLLVDWDHLQRPGFSADYIGDRFPNLTISFERSDWLPTPAGEAMLRNNMPLLAFIGGKNADFTSKDHNFLPGEQISKQMIVINNSRVSAICECTWRAALPTVVTGRNSVTVETGSQALIPIRFKLPEGIPEGKYDIEASVRFNRAEVQKDSFTLNVMPAPGFLKPPARVGLFDPHGDTAKQLMGLEFKNVNAGDDLSGIDVLIIGKAALTKDGPCPDLTRVKDGLKVVMMEQTPDTLEQRFGFRVAEYGLRQVFRRIPDHPLLDGLDEDKLRDWRGEATTLPPRLKYTIGNRYSPQVKWCGLDITRVWRCGCRGNVASALIEKPACGDFTPIVDGGYGLQYAALMEYREGKGMILFCQLDVSGRTAEEPAAQLLLRNILSYASAWKSSPRREVIYVGEQAGREYFESCGFAPKQIQDGKIPSDAVLIASPGCGRDLAGREGQLGAWIDGGRVLAISLDEGDASSIASIGIKMKAGEHIAAHFDAPGFRSWLAGVSPADVHNRDPRTINLVTGGADIAGNGVLAKAEKHNIVFSQLAPWHFSSKSPMNQKRTFRHVALLTSRLAANLGAACSTKLLSNICKPAAAEDKRWLDGLYLDIPEEWDDPYRFFGW